MRSLFKREMKISIILKNERAQYFVYRPNHKSIYKQLKYVHTYVYKYVVVYLYNPEGGRVVLSLAIRHQQRLFCLQNTLICRNTNIHTCIHMFTSQNRRKHKSQEPPKNIEIKIIKNLIYTLIHASIYVYMYFLENSSRSSSAASRRVQKALFQHNAARWHSYVYRLTILFFPIWSGFIIIYSYIHA